MMRPGDLIFVRGRGFIAWAIRQVTGGHYNHVDIYVAEGRSVGSEEGVGIREVVIKERYAREKWASVRVALITDQQAAKIASVARSMVGGKYDSRALAGVWLRFALKFLGFRLAPRKNVLDQPERFFCSELVAQLFKIVDVSFTDGDASNVTPTEIFESKYCTLEGEYDAS